MGLTYVFALVVGLGILTVQSVLGSNDADADGDVGMDKDFHFGAAAGELEAGFDGELDADGAIELDGDADIDGDADLDADLDADADGDLAGDGLQSSGIGIGGIVAVFLSVRFWVFASLGFGLSGTLLTYFSSVAATATLISAVALGMTTGLMAAMAFRALKRSTNQHVLSTAQAVGRTGRLLLPVAGSTRGKVRIEMRGQMVDLIATSAEPIVRGDVVVIEEVDGDVAIVSRAPDELQEPRRLT